MGIREKIGRRLRLLRIAANMSQLDVADHLGISERQVGRIERGEADMRLSLLERWGAIFHLKPKKLLRLKVKGFFQRTKVKQ